MPFFNRELNLAHLRSSAFIFGPRMTGKTTLLKSLKSSLYINLLDPEQELSLRQNPKIFWEQTNSLRKNSLIIVDEIQRVPVLLDYVQMGMDQSRHQYLLSGSSARKLKRGGANLLGGRALDLKLHPLSVKELRNHFDVSNALEYGTLPHIYTLLTEKKIDEARQFLKSYVTIYIKEEIQAEAITRNLGAFQRFLPVAAQSNAQIIEYANISRECSVPMSTVKEYYQILEDTLLGEFLWPHDRSERKKARPKFYFFDCGVVRALQNRLNDPPTPVEKGFLFENWFFREMVRLRDYSRKNHEITLWRQGDHEIDFLIIGGRGPKLAIECKTGHETISASTLHAFRKSFPRVPLIIASLGDDQKRQLDSSVQIYPWREALRQCEKLA